MNVNRFICTGQPDEGPRAARAAVRQSVCELRVAVDGMGRGGEPGFITVSVFGKPGEAAAEYLGKGWLVAVDGRLEFGEWETRHGRASATTTRSIGNVEFLAAPARPSEEEPEPPRSRRREPVAA